MTHSMKRRMNNYANLRTIPAMLGTFYTVAALYQYGGISSVTIKWLDYTLTTQHATIGSLAVFAVAFMSSETSDFHYYEDWEKVVIGAGPALMLANQYLPMIGDPIADSTALAVGAFLASVASFGVAIR